MESPTEVRFVDLQDKMLAFKIRIAIIFQGQGLCSGPLHSKYTAFCFCVVKPTKSQHDLSSHGHLSGPLCNMKIHSFHLLPCFIFG